MTETVRAPRLEHWLLRAGCALLFALLAFAATGQSLSVAYVEGESRVRSGSSWVALSIGDSLSVQSVVQLSEGAYVELKSAETRITLSQKGIYRMQSVLSSFRALGSAGAAKALLQSLSRVTSGTARNQNTASGARAAKAPEEDDSPWATSSAQPYIDTGKEYRRSGQYDRAIAEFLRALELADESAAAEIHYELAAAYHLKGDTHNALKQVASVPPQPRADWAADFVILKATLLVDTYAFDQAVSWLTQPGNDLSADALRAAIYQFLLGVGYQGAGNSSKGKEALSRVIQISGEGDLAEAAARLLQNN